MRSNFGTRSGEDPSMNTKRKRNDDDDDSTPFVDPPPISAGIMVEQVLPINIYTPDQQDILVLSGSAALTMSPPKTPSSQNSIWRD